MTKNATAFPRYHHQTFWTCRIGATESERACPTAELHQDTNWPLRRSGHH